jgi:S-adenosylmethionine synthetase
MSTRIIHTSESVSEGHPDKLADQISDALLDEALSQDPLARVAIETLVTHGMAVIAGELTMEGYVDMPAIVRRTIMDAGYTHTDLGLDGAACGVMIAVQEQSPDIARGVDIGGAGDQGMMFGLATNETPELMPLPIACAHALTRASVRARKDHASLGFRPDMKAQVSVIYEGVQAKAIDTIVVSAQHDPGLSHGEVAERVRERIIRPVLDEYRQYDQGGITEHINPTGLFVIGGPKGDTGLTGRKIIVDTYGGLCPHGGGAFSGKDPTKVDRSAAYMARHVAKTVVAAGLATRCQVGLAYAIGVAEPVALNLVLEGAEASAESLEKGVREVFDLTPSGIIRHLGLRATRFLPTARNGHFGNPEFPWEQVTKADELRSAVG